MTHSPSRRVLNLLLIAALPQEAGALRSRTGAWHRLRAAPCNSWRRESEGRNLFLIQAGMGNHRLAEVFDWAVSRRRIDLMISFGFGGGLTPTLQVGDVCLCDRFCRWDGGSRSIEPGGFTTPLGFWTESLGDRLSWTHCIDVTTAGLAPKRELARGLTPLILRSQALVDMESFTLARLAREASIPFLTLRSISDTLDQEIDFDLSLISDDQGSLETRRIALAVLHRPGLALTMAGLWHHSRRAAATLGLSLIHI